MSRDVEGRLPWLRLLSPLTPFYAAATAARNTAYDRGWLTPRRLQAPVISIGNLSVGGAGKTPLVIHLAQLLTARGYAVDVLSRGYGRRTLKAEQVRLDAEREADLEDKSVEAEAYLSPAARYGDEPLLIAEATGLPIFVAPSRYAAGVLAEQTLLSAPHAHVASELKYAYVSLRLQQPGAVRPHIHLLDDGFQHRQLARSVDVVVLHRSDFTAKLLPGGRLREPLSSLRRASIAVLREEDSFFEPELRRRYPHLIIWRLTREIVLPEALHDNSAMFSTTPPCTGVFREPLAALPSSAPAHILPIDKSPPARSTAVAFCGIAHPGEFFHSLTRAGVSLAATHAYRDHHAFTQADISTLVRSVQTTGARSLLTTEKDLIRLHSDDRARLNQAALLSAIPLRAKLLDEDAAMRQLMALAQMSA